MKILILMISILVSISAVASSSAYQLAVTRGDLTRTRVAYNFWSGEYPTPVIDVTENTTITAYQSLRTLDKPVACTISQGLYHPWSETSNSVMLYYTIAAVNSYSVVRDFTLEEANVSSDPMISGVEFSIGDQVVNVIYLSEGWCRGTQRTPSGQRTDVDFFCDDITTSDNLRVIQEDWDYQEQWMYLSCSEGYTAFVQDQSLLAQPKIKEGQILGYGEVGSANNE